MLRNKCKFNKKQQNVTAVLFVVKQFYQPMGKIKAEEGSGEEGGAASFRLSPVFPHPSSPFPFPLIFPSLEDG